LFKKGYMGWQDSSVFFNKFFGRVLDDYDDPVRTNRLQIFKGWQSFSLDTETLVYVDSTKRADWKDQTQDYRSPVERPSESRREPLHVQPESEHDNFWQEGLRGLRALLAAAYYPYALPPYSPSNLGRVAPNRVDQYKTDNRPWSEILFSPELMTRVGTISFIRLRRRRRSFQKSHWVT
jgi:hypothetical protein